MHGMTSPALLATGAAAAPRVYGLGGRGPCVGQRPAIAAGSHRGASPGAGGTYGAGRATTGRHTGGRRPMATGNRGLPGASSETRALLCRSANTGGRSGGNQGGDPA